MSAGGKREGAGRKPKSDEIQLIEALDKHIDQEEVFGCLACRAYCTAPLRSETA